jgi:hypothetical protein
MIFYGNRKEEPRMIRPKRILILAVILILACFSLADAQPWVGKGRWGAWAGNYHQWRWDPAKVETITGEVISKDIIPPTKGRNIRPAVGMTLKTDKRNLYVHLGPQWYFDRQELSINVGDAIEVTGSKIEVDGKPVLLVSTIKKGEKTWQFRDPQGFPYWSGRRWQ